MFPLKFYLQRFILLPCGYHVFTVMVIRISFILFIHTEENFSDSSPFFISPDGIFMLTFIERHVPKQRRKRPVLLIAEHTVAGRAHHPHYSDVIMRAMASQIVPSVCLTVCSGADQRRHQSSAPLAFERGIHR